jgi:hypothetical protein
MTSAVLKSKIAEDAEEQRPQRVFASNGVLCGRVAGLRAGDRDDARGPDANTAVFDRCLRPVLSL